MFPFSDDERLYKRWFHEPAGAQHSNLVVLAAFSCSHPMAAASFCITNTIMCLWYLKTFQGLPTSHGTRWIADTSIILLLLLISLSPSPSFSPHNIPQTLEKHQIPIKPHFEHLLSMSLLTTLLFTPSDPVTPTKRAAKTCSYTLASSRWWAP